VSFSPFPQPSTPLPNTPTARKMRKNLRQAIIVFYRSAGFVAFYRTKSEPFLLRGATSPKLF
jgi:hypothetical protein